MFGGAANNHPHPYAANVHPRGCAGHPKVHVLCSLVGRTLTPTLAPAVSIVALAENALQFKFHARLAWRPPKPPESAASTVALVMPGTHAEGRDGFGWDELLGCASDILLSN